MAMIASKPIRPLLALRQRGFSTFKPGRVPVYFQGRSLLRGDPIDSSHYRVRVQRPSPFTRKNINRKLLRYVPLLILLYYISPITIEFVQEEEEEEEEEGVEGQAGEHHEKEHVSEDDSPEDEDDETLLGSGMFVPLTWPRAMPQQFYRGSDPEWQEYVSLTKDRKRQQGIFDELIQSVRSNVNEHQKLRHFMGPIDAVKGRHWLDVVFPQGPPTSYVQLGIEITSEYIALASREVSQSERIALSRYFNSGAVLSSLGTTCSNLYQIAAENLKTWVNPTDEQEPDRLGSPPYPKMPSSAAIPPLLSRPTEPTGKPSPSAQESKDLDQEDYENGESESSTQVTDIPYLPGSGPHGAQRKLLKTFLATFSKVPATWELPRGCILLTGLIECRGSRANATIDVVAAYDLFENRFVHLSAKIRRLAVYRQRPQGGM